MAEWVDVTGPEYLSGDWDEGALQWELWHRGTTLRWIYGYDGDGNYDPNFVYKVRVTVNITSVHTGDEFSLEIPDGESVEYVPYGSTPGVGEHTITYDLNTPGHIPYELETMAVLPHKKRLKIKEIPEVLYTWDLTGGRYG